MNPSVSNPILLTDDQLQLIRDMSGNFMTPSDIAFMIRVPADEFRCWIQDDNHPAGIAYKEAKITAILEIRRKIIGMAKKGSPQAETLANQLIQDQMLGED